MRPSLREGLAASHVAAINIAVLLFWFASARVYLRVRQDAWQEPLLPSIIGSPPDNDVNWLLNLLGRRGREYRAADFVVRIESIHREAVSLIHTRDGTTLNMEGVRIGKRWGGIEVQIPQEIQPTQVPQIAHDLQTAFVALGYEYVISRSLGMESVSENEREAAISELRQMGYEVEVSADRKQIRPKPIPGSPPQDTATLRRQAPRMMALLQCVHGKRRRLEVLAKSKEFQHP